jgi:hypothetical protein
MQTFYRWKRWLSVLLRSNGHSRTLQFPFKERDKYGGLLQGALAGYTNVGYYRGETQAEIEKINKSTGSFR